MLFRSKILQKVGAVKIAPDVDFDRAYLLQDLLMSGFVERYGYIEGVGAAPASAPRPNLTGDPYYTDGLRAVIFLSDKPTALENIERLPWEIPRLPSAKRSAIDASPA